MATGKVNTGNKRSNIKVLWKLLVFWFKKKILRKEYQSYSEFKKSCKRKSKNNLIDELMREAAQANKNKFVYVDKAYRKELRKYSKNNLIDALLKIKLGRQFDLPIV